MLSLKKLFFYVTLFGLCAQCNAAEPVEVDVEVTRSGKTGVLVVHTPLPIASTAFVAYIKDQVPSLPKDCVIKLYNRASFAQRATITAEAEITQDMNLFLEVVPSVTMLAERSGAYQWVYDCIFAAARFKRKTSTRRPMHVLDFLGN